MNVSAKQEHCVELSQSVYELACKIEIPRSINLEFEEFGPGESDGVFGAVWYFDALGCCFMLAVLACAEFCEQECKRRIEQEIANSKFAMAPLEALDWEEDE